MSVFSIKFWGVRGSIPSPGPHTANYGGNTSCIELRHAGTLFILDAGTGIRELGDSLIKESMGRAIKGNLFITHTHWDHIQGFPFFMPAYKKENQFKIFGPRGPGKSFEDVFRGLMNPLYFPVELSDLSASLQFIEVNAEPIELGGLRVQSMYTNHPGMDLAYRFFANGRSVTYLTDHEPYQTMRQVTETARKLDRNVEKFCEGTDLLICDGQYTEEEYRTRRTWGHSRYLDTVHLALSAGVKQLAVHHHDASHSDEQLDAIAVDCQEIILRSGKKLDCVIAQEGLSIEI